jgi:TonB family protein
MSASAATRYSLASGVLASVGLHAFAAAALSAIPSQDASPEGVQVEVSLSLPNPPEEASAQREPESERESEAQPEPEPAPRLRPKAPAEQVQTPVAEPLPMPNPPPVSAGPLDLTGTTLTAPGGGWAAAPGTGAPRQGPIRTSSGPRPRPSWTAAPPATPRTVVPATSLAQPPRPPNLDATLRANYPPSARAQGVAGEAVVTVQVAADGLAGGVVVVGESFEGFGEACRRTVMGSVWKPPRDAAGRPYATTVRYRCRFRVD